MKFYIPFGDWSQDGHGRTRDVLVEAPSMDRLLDAQKTIKGIWGENFFDGMAQSFEDNTISLEVQESLASAGYDMSEGGTMWREEIYDFYGERKLSTYVEIDWLIDAFIFLLNHHGAGIEVISDYPQINNWTCPGFETVGYGCFDP